MKKSTHRILFLAAIAALVAVTACDKETVPPQPQLIIDGFTPRGASLARFSVSITNQVRFSRGNLQYQASTNRWRFAPNQYECIGVANDNISTTNSGWIDLFGWGTSGWKSGAHDSMPTATTIFPQCYGPGQNDLVNNNAEADWAYHNPIQYGGDTVHLWRTLTADEWRFLLTGRPNAVDKVGVATVDDVKGLVILPDDWSLPTELDFTPGITDTVPIDLSLINRYTSAEWNTMQLAGAIFLPAAGCRSGNKTTDVDRYGYYWSTSSGADTTLARNIVFSTQKLHADHPSERHYGFCIRPVFDIR